MASSVKLDRLLQVPGLFIRADLSFAKVEDQLDTSLASLTPKVTSTFKARFASVDLTSVFFLINQVEAA